MRAAHIVILTLVLALGSSPEGAEQVLVPSGPAPAAVDPVVIPLELLANRPVVRFTVNGQGPFAFLVAPSAPRSVIDPELAESLKLRQPKPGAPELTVDLGFGAAAKTLKMAIAIEDMARLAADFGREMRPRGIISLSAWKDHMVTVDYLQWRVTVEPGALPEPNQKDVFALGASGDFTLPAAIADHILECRVDPLFPGNLVLPQSAIVPQQMDGTARDGGSIRTSEGVVRVQEARLATNVMLGPFVLTKPVVLIAATGETATVGTPWLGRFAVTYDVTNARVRLARPAAALSRR